jgi:hypothetical protein
MKLFPAPILAFLASSSMFACALAPPSPHSTGGSGGSTTQASSARGGSSGASHSGGGSKASSSLSGGGSLAPGGTVAEGSSIAAGATGSGGSINGGSVSASSSGGTASGGTGGITANGGSGGSVASGGMTGRGGSMSNSASAGRGGTTSSGGTAGSGGSSARGGTLSSGGSGGGGTGGTPSSHSQPAPITNGSSGFTTRYWDCCKPSCGWSANANGKPTKTCGKDGVSTVGNDTQSACSGGSGFMCYWGSPWSVSDTLSFGFAAHNGVPCGTCFQLQFTGKGHYGSNEGATSLNGKTMIVQVINVGGIDSSQFDLLIPGGGVGANNACTSGASQWGSVDIGATSGGILTSCKDKACVTQKCQAAFGSKPDLMAGCTWFTGWFNDADNPDVVFKQISCPSEITAKSGIGS